MKTQVGALLAAARSRLAEPGNAELLLSAVLDCDRGWLIAHRDDCVSPGDATRFTELVTRREAGEPVAYLLGRAGFWSLDLAVSPATLVPRAETEMLVEQALARMPAEQAMEVADLGTGSGTVALALAAERPRARILATDASADALVVARDNARRNRLDNVHFAQGDWCEALGNQQFDLIVSNPPYVAAGDLHLGRGDLRFEPEMALVSGPEGLDAIGVIVRCARNHLRDGGWLLFEHGFQQGDAARELLAECGYADVFTASDLEHRPRVSGGRRA